MVLTVPPFTQQNDPGRKSSMSLVSVSCSSKRMPLLLHQWLFIQGLLHQQTVHSFKHSFYQWLNQPLWHGKGVDQTFGTFEWSAFIIFISLLQVLKDVELEHLGGKSGYSFKSIPSYRQSYRGGSCKRQIEQKANNTHPPEKVRKCNV